MAQEKVREVLRAERHQAVTAPHERELEVAGEVVFPGQLTKEVAMANEVIGKIDRAKLEEAHDRVLSRGVM
jgi:hypothetical protein